MVRRRFTGEEVASALISKKYYPQDRTGSHLKLRYEHPDGEVRNVTIPLGGEIRTGTLRNIARVARRILTNSAAGSIETVEFSTACTAGGVGFDGYFRSYGFILCVSILGYKSANSPVGISITRSGDVRETHQRRYLIIGVRNGSHMPISHNEVLGGEPHIEGTRVGVRHVVALAIDGGQSPAYVAEQFDITLAQVHEALAYYYTNPDEVRAAERENKAAFDALGDDESRLQPKEPAH